ncbi:MAG: archease [Candidatus Thorarchaeota archaeon]|jgi:SHS2 domain-containing protein
MSDHGFKFHEHTADITVECWASTLELAFAEAALATFEVIMDTSTVEPVEGTKISVSGHDLSELLVEWIGQVISLIDIEYKFYTKFEIDSLSEGSDGYHLEGTAWGEDINHEKHDTRTEVKAMTYADLRIETEQDITRIWFTLDL